MVDAQMIAGSVFSICSSNFNDKFNIKLKACEQDRGEGMGLDGLHNGEISDKKLL